MRAAALFQNQFCYTFHMCGVYVATHRMLVGLSTSLASFHKDCCFYLIFIRGMETSTFRKKVGVLTLQLKPLII